MSDQDTFERILAALHEATLDDAEWPATSALIDEACGTVGNALLVGDGPLQSDCIGLYYRGQRHKDLEQKWLKVYQPINEFAPRFLQLPDSQMVFAPDLYTAEELKTSRAYNEGLRELAAQQSVLARLDGLDGGHIAWVSADPARYVRTCLDHSSLCSTLGPSFERDHISSHHLLLSCGPPAWWL